MDYSSIHPYFFTYVLCFSRIFSIFPTTGNTWKDVNSVLGYFTDEGEIAAKVSELYKQAKIKKIPFILSLQNFLEFLSKALRQRDFSEEEINFILAKVSNSHLQYQKKRFPKAKS